jgi:hypothetical protein
MERHRQRSQWCVREGIAKSVDFIFPSSGGGLFSSDDPGSWGRGEGEASASSGELVVKTLLGVNLLSVGSQPGWDIAEVWSSGTFALRWYFLCSCVLGAWWIRRVTFLCGCVDVFSVKGGEADSSVDFDSSRSISIKCHFCHRSPNGKVRSATVHFLIGLLCFRRVSSCQTRCSRFFAFAPVGEGIPGK